MAQNLAALIAHIHASPVMAMLVVTGGGTQALADLLAVPGASRTVLEALVPYSDSALAEFLGTTPDQAVSPETATALARAAYKRATVLRPENEHPLAGVACTAALATDRPKKGQHRAHIGLATGEGVRVFSLTLEKGARDRQEEERVVSDLVLGALAQMCGVQVALDASLMPEEHLTIQVI